MNSVKKNIRLPKEKQSIIAINRNLVIALYKDPNGVSCQSTGQNKMAEAADGRAHCPCLDFPEMTEYAGVNLGLQAIIMGKQEKLHLLNQKV